MRELKITNKTKIKNNTLIALNDNCEDIKKGDYLIDNSGTRYLILSIGVSVGRNQLHRVALIQPFWGGEKNPKLVRIKYPMQ